MKEGGQGMEVIEKTRWEGDKTVVVQKMIEYEIEVKRK